ncbi:MAG: HAD family phosphatase [Spirochaetes bacterium]|nr:HAD family phosphatase [Spirochaetota bacterium]
MSNIHAVLFDLDGLIADTEGLHVTAYREAFDTFGMTVSEEEMYRGMGVSTRENVERLMKDHNIPFEKKDEFIRIRYEAYFRLVKSEPVSFMDGAVECLKYAKEKGVRRGLVTSSIRKHGEAVLANLQSHNDSGILLDRYFEIRVFGDDIKKSKPEPEIYLKALARLSIRPEHCVALEDSEAGVISAKAAGIRVFAVPNRHTLNHRFDMADEVLRSLLEIPKRGLLD